MADRPILFSAPMVKALLAGRKMQTRRVIKPQPPEGVVRHCWYFAPRYGFTTDIEVPTAQWHVVRLAAQPGDRLWVREAHALVPATAYRCSEDVVQTINPVDSYEAAVYRADWERSAPPWRPSIHMPRWASRLTLIVDAVKVERLQDISDGDASAEGVPDALEGNHGDEIYCPHCRGFGVHAGLGQNLGVTEVDCAECATARLRYRNLWAHINGVGSWEANPFVAAYTFRVIPQNIDQVAA